MEFLLSSVKVITIANNGIHITDNYYIIIFIFNPFFSFSENNSEIEMSVKLQPMYIGNLEAPVTIIEYASFTCPHCATFHNEILPKLKKDYIKNGKVLLEYREVYFDGPGLWAGLLARCQGDKKYFPMVDLIYKKQKDSSGFQIENK